MDDSSRIANLEATVGSLAAVVAQLRRATPITTDSAATTTVVKSTTTNTTNVNGAKPIFITPVTVVSSAGSVDWTTYDASASIPSSAVAVILDYEASMTGPDTGDIDARLWIRSSSSGSPYLLHRGRAAASGDNAAWGGQGSFPVSGQRFDYQIELPGYDGGALIRLVGYYG